MLIGDPYEFALWLDPCPHWTSDSFTEGLYLLCIDSKYLINRQSFSCRAATLSGEYDWWKYKLNEINALKPCDPSKYSPEELFAVLDYSAYGNNQDLDGPPEFHDEVALRTISGVELAPTEVLDNGWKVYFFVDAVNLKDVLVYKYYKDPNPCVFKKEYARGQIGEFVQLFIDGLHTEIEQPRSARLQPPQNDPEH